MDNLERRTTHQIGTIHPNDSGIIGTATELLADNGIGDVMVGMIQKRMENDITRIIYYSRRIGMERVIVGFEQTTHFLECIAINYRYAIKTRCRNEITIGRFFNVPYRTIPTGIS